MHAARAARLRPTAQSHLFEKIFHLHRHEPHIIPFDARPRIAIDAQLVGVIEIVGPHGVRVQLDAAEIDDPGEAGGVIDDYFFGCTSRRKRERNGAQPVRRILRRPFLIERRLLGAIDEAFEHVRPIADAGDGSARD